MENQKLQSFLGYLDGVISDDDLVQRLDKALGEAKNNTGWKVDYMKFEIEQEIREDKARKEAVTKTSIEIARNLLDMGTMGFAEIAKATKLSLSQIEELTAST